MASNVGRGLTRGVFVFGIAAIASCSMCKDPEKAKQRVARTGDCVEHYVADNGLSSERAGFYHDSEGSELFPYGWFLLMENKYTNKRFADDLERFGLVWQNEADEDLPIGLTVKMPRDLAVPFRVEMIGINCTACHVGQLQYDKKCLRIDGAPNMFDVAKFYVEMLESAKDTLTSPSKLWKLVRGVPASSDPDAQSDAAALKDKEDAGLDTLMKALEAEGHPELQKLGTLIDTKADELKAGLEHLENNMNNLEEVRAEGAGGAELAASIDALIKGEIDQLDADAAQDPSILGKLLVGQAPLVTPSQGMASPLVSLQGLEGLKSRATGIRTQGILDIPELVLGWMSRLRGRVRLFAARVRFLTGVAANNTAGSTVALGGRTDAFGFARNFLFGAKFGFVPNTAPIAYPHLWGFGELEWLHWNSNTTSVLERNIGQALGVGAIVASDNTSSLVFESLHTLEESARKLEPPVWPDFFPAIDADRAAKGKLLYADRCLACHGDIEAGPPPGGQKRAIKEFELDDIRTDPNQALNFDKPLAPGTEFYAELEKTLKAIENKYVVDNGIPAATATSWDPNGAGATWRKNGRYGARPLRGIWASAPYLHNNSVPTLDDLLQPEAQRPAYFQMGSREYDPVRVGYSWTSLTKETCKDDCYDTTLAGNSNAGHSNVAGTPYDYGTTLSADQRAQLIEYIKQFPKPEATP